MGALQMSDDLKAKLAALTEAGEFEKGAMHLGQSGGPAAMLAVLHVIDTTILPRVLQFSVEDSYVSLAVSGRRLRRCEAASKDLKAPKTLLAQSLSNDTPKPVEKVGKLLKLLTSKIGNLTVHSTAEASASGAAESGVSFSGLIEYWEVDPEAKPLTRLERFMELIQSDLIASIDEAGTSTHGDAASVKALKAAMPDIVDMSETKLGSLGKPTQSPKFLILEGYFPADALVVHVHIEDSKAFVAVPKSAFAKVAAAWNQSLS